MRERVEKKRADDVARPAVEVDRAGTGWLYPKPFKHLLSLFPVSSDTGQHANRVASNQDIPNTYETGLVNDTTIPNRIPALLDSVWDHL